MNDVFEPLGPLMEPQDGPALIKVAAIYARDTHGRALCQLRDDLPGIAAGGIWGLFGGKVEAGETLRAAAVREFFEETGIVIAEGDLGPMVQVASQTLSNWRIYVFELARPVRPDEIRLGEGACFAFLTEAQVRDYEFISTYKQFFEKIFD